MEVKKVCEYGSKCYRKNPRHYEEFSHPVEDVKPTAAVIGKRRRKDSSPKKILKQTKLEFFHRVVPLDGPQAAKEENLACPKTTNAAAQPKRPPTARKRKPAPVAKTVFEESSEAESDNDTSGVCDVTSNSWVFQENCSDKKNEPLKTEQKAPKRQIENNLTPSEKIKKLFLVEMPQDFYIFYEFCATINERSPIDALRDFGLKLVGPYDVLAGFLSPGSVSLEEALIHWRFFMDPPEFQTVLVADKGLHFGYWRDEPKTKDTFLASNTVPDCKIKPDAPNIFGTVLRYLDNYSKNCTPFDKVKASNLITNLKQFGEKRGVGLSATNDFMSLRKKKVVARTFNDIGIVVPFDKKTDVGYRPILETNVGLKKLCQGAMKAKDGNSPEMEEIERLVNAANIANDESDFGNGLELGLNLFCMGSNIFDDFVEHLLTTAYSLLNRPEWGNIIKAHLKKRRTGLELSVIKN